jgi:succinylglutamate desuccinylase
MLSPDFEAAARRFEARGLEARRLAASIWRYRSAGQQPALRLLLTAGVHGDETAPIEMLARCLPGWAECAPAALDLTLALGNVDAIAAGRRHLNHDMNRMFGPGSESAPPAAWGSEGERAAVLAQSLHRVLQDADGVPTVHLDLHTTIRPSLKPTFAIVPADDEREPLLHWLAHAGLHAVVLSPGPHPTLSAFTRRLGAAACTVELGRVGRFGSNDDTLLQRFEGALDALVRSGRGLPRAPDAPPATALYRVTRELTRRTEAFELLVPDDAPNFQPLAAGQLVARDRLDLVHARQDGECVLFPNRHVALGLRAGLLVAPVAPSA